VDRDVQVGFAGERCLAVPAASPLHSQTTVEAVHTPSLRPKPDACAMHYIVFTGQGRKPRPRAKKKPRTSCASNLAQTIINQSVQVVDRQFFSGLRVM
jgi:hypothetical protein